MQYEPYTRFNLLGTRIQLQSFGPMNNGRIRAVEGLMTGTRDTNINPYRVSSNAFDAIHLNAGIHDSYYYGPFYTDRTTLDMYKASMENILATLWAENPAVQVIVATTTPPLNVASYDTDCIRLATEFNDYIRELGSQGVVRVNDLWQFANDNQLTYADGIHFDEPSAEALGYEVARHIRETVS